MGDGADHTLPDVGDLRAEVLHKFFHKFTPGVLIRRAGIEYDGEVVTTGGAADVFFIYVEKRADDGGFGAR